MSESHAVGRGGSRLLGFPNGRHWPPLPETPEGEKQQSSGGLASGLQGDHSPPPPLSACQEIGTRGHSGGKVWSRCDLTISGKQPKASTLGQANELGHLRGENPKCWRPNVDPSLADSKAMHRLPMTCQFLSFLCPRSSSPPSPSPPLSCPNFRFIGDLKCTGQVPTPTDWFS